MPTDVGPSAASTTLPTDVSQMGTKSSATDTNGERKSSRHLPLFHEPLSNHSAEEKVAAMRAAIAAGADVHQLDQEPIVGYNEGRPLDACLNVSHMAEGARLADNIPAIELLLQHGADPRLGARPTKFAPLRVATYYAENTGSEEDAATWKRILTMFEDAVLRLEEANRA